MGKGLFQTISRLALIAFLAVAILTPSIGAQMQASYRGQFTLPFDAKWGGIALRPGDYQFSVVGFSTVHVRQGQKDLGTVLLQSYDTSKDKGENPSLICIRHDATCAVRELELPRLGTFYFAVPKGQKALVAQQPELLQRVPIQMTGM